MKHERVVSIGPEHPAIPGHFPGHPVVPGVLVLEAVIETLQEHCGWDVVLTGLPAVKLSSPLLPGEPLTIEIEPEDSAADFTCRVGRRIVAAGSIRFSRPPDDRVLTP